MLIPIGDENLKQGARPFVTWALLIINITIFIYQAFALSDSSEEGFIYHYGSIPIEISKGVDWFTLVTSMFLHGGILHLAGNMLFLYIFGDNIETAIGNINFLIFYILGGIVAALAQVAFQSNSNIPMVGASGAISACLGAYLIMFPKFKIKIFAVVFVFKVAAFVFIGLWILQQVLETLNVFKLPIPGNEGGGVAYLAHIGGFVFGLVAALWLRKKFITKDNAVTN